MPSNPNCFDDLPYCDRMSAHRHYPGVTVPADYPLQPASITRTDEELPPQRSFLARLADSVRGRK